MGCTGSGLGGGLSGAPSGATGEGGNLETTSGETLSNTPPLSIPAPVPRTDRDEDAAKTPCHVSVKFKVSLKRNVPVSCQQIATGEAARVPNIHIAIIKGLFEGPQGPEKDYETQCLSDGFWHSEEIPLEGILDLKGTCHLTVQAHAFFPGEGQLKSPVMTLEDFSENEVREIILSFL